MKKLGLAVLIAALLVLPMSALALEKMSGTDLGDVTGQAGVTVAFGSTTTTTISFDRVAWGDPDGVAGGCGTAAGWLIIDGAITITSVMGCGETLTLDIGTTGAACNQGCVSIPGATTFIAVGVPSTSMNISVPATLTIGLGATSGTITGTLGIVNLANLSVDTGSPSAIYIWAHP